MADLKARRSKIEEKAPRLLAALKKGHSKSDSCQVADIHRDTLANWLKRAEDLDAPDEYIQFYFDYHDARAKGLDKLLKDLDKFDNKTETRVVEKVLVEKGETDDETIERVIERTTTTKHEKSRASHFQRALVKLKTAYPDRWGQNVKGEGDTDPSDDDVGVTDLFDEWGKKFDVGDRCDKSIEDPVFTKFARALKSGEIYVIETLEEHLNQSDPPHNDVVLNRFEHRIASKIFRGVFKPRNKAFGFEVHKSHFEDMIRIMAADCQINNPGHEIPYLLNRIDEEVRKNFSPWILRDRIAVQMAMESEELFFGETNERYFRS